jgi:hypothetical protein
MQLQSLLLKKNNTRVKTKNFVKKANELAKLSASDRKSQLT